MREVENEWTIRPINVLSLLVKNYENERQFDCKDAIKPYKVVIDFLLSLEHESIEMRNTEVLAKNLKRSLGARLVEEYCEYYGNESKLTAAIIRGTHGSSRCGDIEVKITNIFAHALRQLRKHLALILMELKPQLVINYNENTIQFIRVLNKGIENYIPKKTKDEFEYASKYQRFSTLNANAIIENLLTSVKRFKSKETQFISGFNKMGTEVFEERLGWILDSVQSRGTKEKLKKQKELICRLIVIIPETHTSKRDILIARRVISRAAIDYLFRETLKTIPIAKPTWVNDNNTVDNWIRNTKLLFTKRDVTKDWIGEYRSLKEASEGIHKKLVKSFKGKCDYYENEFDADIEKVPINYRPAPLATELGYNHIHGVRGGKLFEGKDDK